MKITELTDKELEKQLSNLKNEQYRREELKAFKQYNTVPDTFIPFKDYERSDDKAYWYYIQVEDGCEGVEILLNTNLQEHETEKLESVVKHYLLEGDETIDGWCIYNIKIERIFRYFTHILQTTKD